MTKKDKIPATGEHNYVEISRTEATCVDDGVIVKKCDGCSERIEEVIPATGEHNYVETSRTDATCVLDGEIIGRGYNLIARSNA